MTKLIPVLGLGVGAAILAAYAFLGTSPPPRNEANRIKELVPLADGDTIAEIGAGSGELAEALGGLLPGSRLYVTELDPDKLRRLQDLAAGHPHLEALPAAEKATNLPPACCDLIYMRRVYHHMVDPSTFLKDVRRSLRRGGRVAIIDFRPKWYLRPWMPRGIPSNRGGHGIAPELVRQELESAGFRWLETQEPWLDGGFLVLAQMP